MPGSPLRLRRRRAGAGRAARRGSASTREEILAEVLGLGAAEIGRLHDTGVVAGARAGLRAGLNSIPINRYSCATMAFCPAGSPPVSATEPARITCDIGGTFTDVVVSDETGKLTVAKSLTQPGHLFGGLHAALERAAEQLAEPLEQLLARTSLFIFSTTQATNAILEGKTARTAFLCTEGFPDILIRREGGSLRPYDYTRPFPDPYVPAALHLRDRRARRRRRQRLDAAGRETPPAASSPTPPGSSSSAVSVCLLWATANPAHELALGRMIEEELPGVPYSLSHQVNPIVREYRRASSAAIDASLKPLMQRHLPEIASGLEAEGFARRAAGGDHRRRRRADVGAGREPAALGSLGPLAGAGRRPHRRRLGDRQRRRDRLRHRRHQLRGRPRPRRRPRIHQRDLAGRALRRAPHRALLGRHPQHRGRRRIDRLGRSRRPAAGRDRRARAPTPDRPATAGAAPGRRSPTPPWRSATSTPTTSSAAR